jgi:hypothetical protein
MASSYQIRIGVYGGLPEEHDLQTMHQHADLMRKKYANHVRYHAHKEQLRALGHDLQLGSSTFSAPYSLLGTSSRILGHVCKLSLSSRIPNDRWPLNMENGIPFSQGVNGGNTTLEFSDEIKSHVINFNSDKQIDLSKKFSRFQGFQFTKPLNKFSGNSIVWASSGVSVTSSTDDWRQCPAGIAMADTRSGIFVALLLAKTGVYVLYARISIDEANTYSQFISTMRLCSREESQEHVLQIAWENTANHIVFSVDGKCGITIENLGLVPGTIYCNNGEDRRYNTVFTSVKRWGYEGTIETDCCRPESFHFGIGVVNLMDLADYEHPSLEVQNNTVQCNYKCSLSCRSFSLDDGYKVNVNNNHVMGEISELVQKDESAPLDWNHFFTLDEIYKLLDSLASRYSERCKTFNLGRTPIHYKNVADIPITAIYVGNVAKDAPHMLLIGCLHARERASLNPSLAYLYWLVCSNSQEATKLRSTCALVYLPVADPGSYIRDDASTVWDSDSSEYINVPGHFIRKNSNRGDVVLVEDETGVDLDRNFGVIRNVTPELTYSGSALIPAQWSSNSYFRNNGSWGMQGSSSVLKSPIYMGIQTSKWQWNSYGGGTEIETRAIQRICQEYPFRSALIHAGIGYRLAHPQFPPKDKSSSSAWTVSEEDKHTYTRLCRHVVIGTRYLPCAPHVPASGTAADWIYTAGQLRKVRGNGNLGTLSLVAETGRSFYPSFTEMEDAVINGIALNLAVHSTSARL